MTLSMTLRSLITEIAFEYESEENLFLPQLLDGYMPLIMEEIKSKIKSTKPIEGRTDAQVAVDRWEKKLLEELE